MAMIYGKLILDAVKNGTGDTVGGRCDDGNAKVIAKAIKKAQKKEGKDTKHIYLPDPHQSDWIYLSTNDPKIRQTKMADGTTDAFVEMTEAECVAAVISCQNKAPIHPADSQYIAGKTMAEYRAAIEGRTPKQIKDNGIWGTP